MSIKFNPPRSKPGPKPKGEPVITFSVAIRPNLVDRLEQICAKLDMGKSAAIASMIERYRL